MVSIIEIGVGLSTICIGFISLILILKNRKELNKGMIKDLLTRFSISIILLLLFSLWHTSTEYFDWKNTIGEFMEYPEYVFISLTYISFLFLSLKVIELVRIYKFK